MSNLVFFCFRCWLQGLTLKLHLFIQSNKMLISTIVPKYTVVSGSSLVSLEGGNLLSTSSMPWDCDKYSHVNLESPDASLDDIILDQSASSDFAELKPLPYDDFGTNGGGLGNNLDPVLSGHHSMVLNNNTKCIPSSTIDYMTTYSQSDVTSSGSPSRTTMAHKIEPLDFCKVKNLKSIFNIWNITPVKFTWNVCSSRLQGQKFIIP